MSEELTNFQKNYNEWRDKHPTRSPERWISTTNRKKAARFISKQAEKIREAQIQAADDIVISQEQSAKELKREISSGVDDIVNGLEGMKSTFEWGFSELVWQIEKQRETLKGILETLQKPLGTQAKELKKRAEKAYRNGWIDDALQDFIESRKKNRYDFTVHHNLGNIYFFHKDNPTKALESYEKAVKYAEPESSYHASYALLHVGLIKYLKEEFSEAYEATGKAWELSKLFMEARYQHAKYSAKVGKYDEAAEHLERAILMDRGYALRAYSEQDFQNFKEMKNRLNSIINERIQEDTKFAEARKKTAKELLNKAKLKKEYKDSSTINTTQRELDKVPKLLNRGTLYDSQEASKIATDAIRKARIALINTLKSKLKGLKEEKDDINVSGPPMWALTIYFISLVGAVVFGIAAIIGLINSNIEAGFSSLFLAILLGSPFAIHIFRGNRRLDRRSEIKESIEKLNEEIEEQEEKLSGVVEE